MNEFDRPLANANNVPEAMASPIGELFKTIRGMTIESQRSVLHAVIEGWKISDPDLLVLLAHELVQTLQPTPPKR